MQPLILTLLDTVCNGGPIRTGTNISEHIPDAAEEHGQLEALFHARWQRPRQQDKLAGDHPQTIEVSHSRPISIKGEDRVTLIYDDPVELAGDPEAADEVEEGIACRRLGYNKHNPWRLSRLFGRLPMHAAEAEYDVLPRLWVPRPYRFISVNKILFYDCLVKVSVAFC